MSTGAVFKLIANDGKCDRIIMATALLNQRIRDVTCARRRMGKMDDAMPTLVDLERTHIIYVNAHFKPYAAIGFEYNKVKPQSGTPTFGGGVTFSIPQFGDFFHDMVVHTRLGACQGVAGKTPAQAEGSAFPPNVLDGDDTTTAYNIVDARGALVVAGVSAPADPHAPVDYRNYVRYCEYPGTRLYRGTKFDVNGNPLDAYDEYVPVMLGKFCIPPHKMLGYNRLLGQECPLQGYSGLIHSTVVDANAAATPAGIARSSAGQSNQTVALFSITADTAFPVTAAAAALNAHEVQYDVSREHKQYFNGPQTPKPIQPALDLWTKLQFWFCDDVRLSIPSVSIPFGQRYITVELHEAAKLVYESPSIFLETIVNPGVDADRTRTYTPIFQKLGVVAPAIEVIELYINNIFVNPEIHEIFIKRIGFSLIRVYRQQKTRMTVSANEVQLTSLKWPVEYMFVAARPVWNDSDNEGGALTLSGSLVVGGNQNVWRDWHRMTRQVDATVPFVDVTEIPGGDAAEAVVSTSVGKIMPDHYWLSVPTVDTIALTTHGVTIFESNADVFYNSYFPFHYGGAQVMTPEDVGVLFINMALFPRAYQPSGHFNISRARETFLTIRSSCISSTAPADLHVVAVAINFLLITDGSAVLRYST